MENGVKLNERTLFVVVGDRAREQVVNLHYMLSKAVVKSRPQCAVVLQEGALPLAQRKANEADQEDGVARVDGPRE